MFVESFIQSFCCAQAPTVKAKPKTIFFDLEVVDERRAIFFLTQFQSHRRDFLGIARVISLALKSRLVQKWALIRTISVFI